MTENRRTYSALSAEEQSALSVWIDTFEQGYAYEGAIALKKAVKEAPNELRGALLTQLLPPLIDHDRKQQGRTPTLHELRSRFPDLAGELTDAYAQMPSDYRLPTEIRGYRVLRVVGEGGQALVLRAQDDVHSAVAIKLSAGPEHNDLLLRERELLGQCQHRGVPEVIASGIEEERAYFVMPFLRGMTLADKYATHRATAEEAVQIGGELCDVVAHLHARGILHRDIKPQNVWIDEADGVKLIDLGMAIERSSWGAPRPTLREFHGTPAYMSPEQAAGDGDRDGEASDTYSIGATLYWLATGRAPVEGESQQGVLAEASAARLQRDHFFSVAAWPKRLTNACLLALAADPAERPHPPEFAKQLRRVSEKKDDATSLRILVVAGLVIALAGVAAWASQGRMGGWKTLVGLSAPSVRPPSVGQPSPRDDLAQEPQDAYAEPPETTPAEIIKSDLSLAITAAIRSFEPWGSDNRDSDSVGLLTVRVTPTAPQPEAIEYRTSDGPWFPLSRQPGEDSFVAVIRKEQASGGGPIDVRFLASDPGTPSVKAGPFRYDINPSELINDDFQRFVEGLIEEARNAELFDLSEPGWEIREDFSHRYTLVIKDLYYTTNQEEPMKSIAAHVDKRRSAGSLKDGLELHEAFRLINRRIAKARDLWVTLKFLDGSTTRATLFTKPLTPDERREREVAAWKERIGVEGELAKFSHEKFVLTGLRRFAPQITHLHFVGTYFTYKYPAPDTAHQDDQSKSDEVRSREWTVPLAGRSIDTPLTLPPVWNEVLVRARLTDGDLTPVFRVQNSGVACGTGILPTNARPGGNSVVLYVYISHGESPDRSLSIVRHLRDGERREAENFEDCYRSRLRLFSGKPIGASRVRLYSDDVFTKPAEVASPGVVHARYTGKDGGPVGSNTYRLSRAFVEEWASHAMAHVSGPAEIERFKQQQAAGRDEGKKQHGDLGP